MNDHSGLLGKVKKWSFFAIVFASVSISDGVFSKTAPSSTNIPSITSVAKKASPATVSINAKSIVSSQEGGVSGKTYQFEDPFDMFGDNFFQEFFKKSNKKRPAPQSREQIGFGSGFIVSDDGTILTNAHLVQDAMEITVSLTDGREFLAKLVGADPNTDVAVIKIDGKNLPFVTLGNSDALDIGQTVIAIGNPLGLQSSVTAGIVSAKGRNDLSLAKIEDFIQTDAAINRGNSGGPLLNLNGEVIGMNTAIVTNMGSGGYMGIGFAIPSNLIHHVMEELIKTGSITRGFIGVSLQPVTQDLAQAFGLNKIEGAIVSEVAKNSPAERAGIKQGDIILEYNETRVENIASLRNSIALMKADTELTLTVMRDGKLLTLQATIGTNPDDKTVTHPEKENNLGLEFETLTKAQANKLGIHETTGVLVTGVRSGSVAAWSGLRKGAVILAINHKEVASANQFQNELNHADPSKPILLLVKQGEATLFISLKSGKR